jgi:hypothetical protein
MHVLKNSVLLDRSDVCFQHIFNISLFAITLSLSLFFVNNSIETSVKCLVTTMLRMFTLTDKNGID